MPQPDPLFSPPKTPPSVVPTDAGNHHGLWLLLALVLVAVNLRPALTSLAPVLRAVQEAMGLSAASAGLLTTLPILCLGLFAPLAYCVFGWLPTILQDRGVTPLLSGLYLSVSVMAMLLMTFTGLMGCLLAPLHTLWWWVVILGVGQGGGFSMALALIVLRSRDAATAARLSGMVQGIGYTVASLGPLLVGVLHEATGNWNALGVLFAAIIAGALVARRAAGRNRFVLSS